MDAAPSINGTRQTAGGSFPLEAGLRSISTVVLALCVASGLAVAGDAAEQQDFRLSVDVRRVVLTVTVESDDNRFIGGLTKDDFVVFDNGKPQKLIAFSGEDRPASRLDRARPHRRADAPLPRPRRSDRRAPRCRHAARRALSVAARRRRRVDRGAPRPRATPLAAPPREAVGRLRHLVAAGSGRRGISNFATSAVQPVWWLAPRPRPVSPWKNS